MLQCLMNFWTIKDENEKYHIVSLNIISLYKFNSRSKFHARFTVYYNGHCPGIVRTDMWVEIDERFATLTGVPKGATYKKYVEGIALGRAETPNDVAAFVSYLAGPAPMIDGGIVYR